MVLTCNLHVASRGNQFIADLARLYAAALVDLGVDASVRFDEVPVGGRGVVDVVVAPHEWFTVGPSLSERDRARVLEGSALLTTEQPGSTWWEVQLPLVEAAPVVLDLSPVGVGELRRQGIDARRAPLGYHPSIDAWGGSDAGRRDVDVTFMGGTTDRRRAVIGRFAPVLSHRRSRLLFHDPLVPVTEGGPTYVAGADKAALLARTRVLVNVHRDELPYFEWARAVEAMANGAVLLSEPSVGGEPLEPMVHLVVAEADLMGAHLTALLADEPLRAKIARAAYDLLRSELSLADLLGGEVLDALGAAAGRSPAPVAPPPAPGSVLDGLPPAPVAPPPQRSAPEPLEVPDTDAHRTMAGIKRAILGQIRLQRRLDRLAQERTGVDPEAFSLRATPGWEAATPEVSVVVPLYNYGSTVIEAVESALASRGVSVEVLVVEDASTDDSRSVVEGFMAENPDAPVAALLRAANRGLSEARNLGISQARTDLCYLLDADNAVYPDALRKLRSEIEATGAAFAYCILEVFEGPPDLVSALPWDVRSLTLRPYVDAMALIRREAWAAVGGFREGDDALYGLEDYAFWLAMAAAGLEGAWVPEPLVRYRRHPGSMTTVTALDLITPFNHLRRQFPDLPW